MTTAGAFRRATLATVVTEAALVGLLIAVPNVTTVPAALDVGGTTVPTPSSTPEVTVPSVTVGPVSTPEVNVPSEPLPSTPSGGGSGDGGSPGTGGSGNDPRGG